MVCDVIGVGVLIIIYDFGVVVEFVDWVLVMYVGWVVELVGVNDLYCDCWMFYIVGFLGLVFWLDVV